MESTPAHSRLFRVLFFLILISGLCLRAYQYFMGRSLWEDESHLALNLIKYSYTDLFKPLDYIQGAPILFLYLVKTCALLFGYSELSLHAVPFIIDALTYPLFYFVILHLTKREIVALIGFFIFTVNITLIYFSSELKPYSVDVSMYILLTYLTITDNPYVTRRRILLLSIAGCIALLISLSAFIVLFCIACYWFLNWYKKKNIQLSDLKILLPWTVVFLLNYFLFIHNHPSTIQQQANFNFYFCPTHVLSCEFVTFLNKAIDDVFFDLTLRISRDFYFNYMLFLIFIVAIVHLIRRRNYTLLIFTCLPILLHLLLSAMKIYPFTYRLILYQAPALIILIALGIYLIAEFFARKVHLFVGIIIGIVCLSFIVKPSIKEYPLWNRDIKPALSFINDSIPFPEHLYVFDPINNYSYYEKRGLTKKTVYRIMEWEMTPEYFYDLVSSETENFLLLYSSKVQFGYGDIIKDLKKKKLIVKNFSYKGYEVSEIKPLPENFGLVKNLDYTNFDKRFFFNEDKSVALWSTDTAISKPFELPAGKYNISVIARGTPVSKIYPQNKLLINNLNIGEFNAPLHFTSFRFNFELKKSESIKAKLVMDNDLATKNEDRNTFVLSIKIKKISDNSKQ